MTFGRGPERPAALNGPSPRAMRVGIGPPGPCEIEYMYQPPSILAVIFAVPVPPEGTEAGETLMDSETGFCANPAAANPRVIKRAASELRKIVLGFTTDY